MEGQAPLLDPLTERELDILKRLAAGFSDQQIAAELFLSPNTIRWYNRQIYGKFGVGSRTQAIARAQALGLLSDTAWTSPPSSSQTLPVQTTPFIGRSHEIGDVKHLLQTTRLLTLTGVGGTGKTRLALYVASEVRNEFSDGVWFVDLAPVVDPTLVAKTITAAIGVIEQPNEPLLETLQRSLSKRELLLLIDNFEHLLAAAALVSELLAAAPHLKVMITSREALRLAGEQEYVVPPLSLPAADTITIQAVIDSEAGALFVQQARLVVPQFAISADNAPIVAQICARLDGLPLAIELAAARCKLLTPQALLARLDSRLDALASGVRDAPARQRTLRTALEWSYNLLDAEEKTLFGRLAVFRGGGSLDAIEAVCGDDSYAGVLDGLASLVDKSLVQQKEMEGDPRFVMLETIHEYAWERLAASGEASTLRQRHAAFFVKLAERAEPELRLDQQRYWFQVLETEHDNLRAVLEWSLSGGVITLGVRLASALCFYWYAYGYHIEGLHWTQQLLPRLEEAPENFHAKFLIGAAHMMQVRNLLPVKPLLMKALTVSRRVGDLYHTALVLVRLGYTMMGEPEALEKVKAGLTVLRELDHKPGIAHALNILGEIARFSGNDDRARKAYEEALTMSRELGDTRGILITLLNLTFIAQHQGDYKRARDCARQALRLARELDLAAEMAECLVAFAGMIGVTGQARLAASLFGAADSALERMGAFFDAPDRQEFDSMIAAVRDQLDEASFQSAWAEGKDMTLEQAVAGALATSTGSTSVP